MKIPIEISRIERLINLANQEYYDECYLETHRICSRYGSACFMKVIINIPRMKITRVKLVRDRFYHRIFDALTSLVAEHIEV